MGSRPTHTRWHARPLERIEGTASIRRRHRDDTLEVKLSYAPGVTFRVMQDGAIYWVDVEDGHPDPLTLAGLHVQVDDDGMLRWAINGREDSRFATVQDAIADAALPEWAPKPREAEVPAA